MILLTCARMPDLLDKNTLAIAVGLLFPAPENQSYIEEIRNRKDDFSACESLFALALLYEQLRELPCPPIDPSSLIFARNEFGKPDFQDSDVKFNISHSKGYVACAVSVGEELGVDVEASDIPPERACKLAERYFCKSDSITVKKAPHIFSQIWSEKEARAKFFGNSIGNILSSDKNSNCNEAIEDIVLHRFKFGKIPVTLCTKRDYSTIIYTVQ